jgi:hypothetical protein
MSHGFFFENKFGDLVRYVKGHSLQRVVKELVALLPVETSAKLTLIDSKDTVTSAVLTGHCHLCI